jgi:NADH-quinone oxidoreductase subunit J
VTLAPAVEWVAFAILSAIAVAGALGMTTTMGMFRSAIFLMASFLGVAGLFVLLSADLLAWLTVMMYVGGMLVMALFMVLMSHDPGGDQMAGMMRLVGLERAFSAGLVPPGEHEAHGMSGGHQERQGRPDHQEHGHPEHGQQGQGDPGSHGGSGMADMSMFTPFKRGAMALSALAGAILVALVLARPAFPPADASPDPASARQVGLLLMGKYMLAFEAAGLLILLGVFGSVWAARASAYPDPADRARLRAAVDAPPTGAGEEPLRPPEPHTAPENAGPAGAHGEGGHR